MEHADSNFEFLDRLDGEMANLGRLAESYFQEGPCTTLIKMRQVRDRLSRQGQIESKHFFAAASNIPPYRSAISIHVAQGVLN